MAYGAKTLSGTQQEIVSKSVNSPPRIGLRLVNLGAVSVFLGDDSSVSITNGYPLAAGAELILDFEGALSPFYYRGAVHGITDGTSADLRFWEMLQTQ